MFNIIIGVHKLFFIVHSNDISAAGPKSWLVILLAVETDTNPKRKRGC